MDSPGQLAVNVLTASARKKRAELSGHEEKCFESKTRAKKLKREMLMSAAGASSASEFVDTACLAVNAANAVEAHEDAKVYFNARKQSAKKEEDAAVELMHAHLDERKARRLERELQKLPPNDREKQRKQWEQLGFIARTAVAGAQAGAAAGAAAAAAVADPMASG